MHLIITGSFCLLLEAHGGKVSHLSKVTEQVSNMAEIRFQVTLTTREEEGRGHSKETDRNLREREKMKESEDKGQSFPNGGDKR